ncbi:MAG: VOC family protein [Desulfofustis sp.]|jgi:catechol 2,3-dioxygenase-like lactoylglutathione lyase family enzyme|nr:VOC family protein [Desulfofustis sp.]
MQIEGLDHLVLTVRDLDRTVAFYTDVLGMRGEVGPTGRVSLHFGRQKINLHLAAHEFQPCAADPTPGSADLCLLVGSSVAAVCRELAGKGVPVVDGPVQRTGAAGPLLSVYIRDPDGNLIELSHYQHHVPGLTDRPISR